MSKIELFESRVTCSNSRLLLNADKLHSDHPARLFDTPDDFETKKPIKISAFHAIKHDTRLASFGAKNISEKDLTLKKVEAKAHVKFGDDDTTTAKSLTGLFYFDDPVEGFRIASTPARPYPQEFRFDKPANALLVLSGISYTQFGFAYSDGDATFENILHVSTVNPPFENYYAQDLVDSMVLKHLDLILTSALNKLPA